LTACRRRMDAYAALEWLACLLGVLADRKFTLDYIETIDQPFIFFFLHVCLSTPSVQFRVHGGFLFRCQLVNPWRDRGRDHFGMQATSCEDVWQTPLQVWNVSLRRYTLDMLAREADVKVLLSPGMTDWYFSIRLQYIIRVLQRQSRGFCHPSHTQDQSPPECPQTAGPVSSLKPPAALAQAQAQA
jgi:hypothetical protein